VAEIRILDHTRTTVSDAEVVGDLVLVAPSDFTTATGWELKTEGLCRGDVCVALRAHPDVVVDGRIDVAKVAPLLGRSVVVDADAGVVAYGAAASDVAQQLNDLHAADFTLSQLDGTPFTFSSIGRKKKLLVTWASW
jgi:hypothetical protein